MQGLGSFYLDIQSIHLAHEYVLDRSHKCEYPSGREHYGLVYVLSGKAEYRFRNGERSSVTEGDVIFLSPNCAYSIVTENEFRHYTVNFDIHGDGSNLETLEQSYWLLRWKDTQQLERAMKQLVQVWHSKRPGYKMQAVGYLYVLISHFYLAYTSEQSSQAFQRLLPARTYIEKSFHRPLTLEHLAFLTNMSVTNFRREWKKQYVESPMQYRDSLRLSHAKEYLLSGYYSVAEVAAKCGFEDVSYFVRFFRQKTGITPGAFRKNALGK